MNWIKTQSELFFLALSFFSRLPIPASTPYSEERMNRAGRYFALVGALLGLLCALSYLLLTTLFSVDIAIFLTMALSLMQTGAFHEDGLTDMADGVGGGMTTERRLAIMKDSRIGTYGASALIMALLGKYLLLSELAVQTELFWIWIAAYTLSRTVAASLIFDTPYVSDSDQSKSKPLAQKQSPYELLFLICCGLLSIWWLTPLAAAVVVSVALVFRFTFKRWLVSRLGGFTGDCLGAGQQLMELLFYCVVLALLNTGNF
ncbi:putative Cobalamin (vitamin B12) biosynthesis CobS, cobalamin-5-phosphate synthase [Vibrio nigripulchritudo MADA3029]|uniref:adenosylcobinamide-GDP ribazoletransferase n=1 Tax=Vibrio nigripulchritudo TaxID=28173 RepID=UPI0003B2215E|nr:adenosylcobinamide-GDP ribazoletransferase [Vibrio nigripulchritudo]CCN45775.1 putative Cobalamin (vitamin B12) biosynthesis CobS, cobalamin-5-phosphate synthase [Vibrio nigripulchritudo MADA3020]CCN52883.1 putative Cobalamin (vitamin B12) biosynthesis CobS, cobalamin-5-phosphate synthase [Vibrio nigripulchritudo MADA3021]CCN61682.1 putative Cobalamin (vitamin B12) biosynthesis CobS, cobalamin-5-phosphate synthase [Vibrio nigripulchritudo MADA3029]